MTIMYVDDSGSSDYNDHTKYFILSGVLVQHNKIKDLQKSVLEYKHSNFADELMDTEIHTHNIYQSRNSFKSQNHLESMPLLNRLYQVIDTLDCTGILVIINKNRLQKKHPAWNVINTAWLFLLEKYELFLQENSADFGYIIIDKSSNKRDSKIKSIINRSQIKIKPPIRFVDSATVFGLQVADAFAYCAFQHKMNNPTFAVNWSIIHDKLMGDKTTNDFGYVEYPK